MLALAVVGNPLFERNEELLRRVQGGVITLQAAKRINSTNVQQVGLLKRDQARAKGLKARATATGPFDKAPIVGSIPATNQAVDYTVTVRHRGTLNPIYVSDLVIHSSSTLATHLLLVGIDIPCRTLEDTHECSP